MLFNSLEFIFVFLPIVLLLVYYLQQSSRQYLKIKSLVILSLLFYSWWHPALAWLLPFSIIVNYIFGKKIQSSNKSTQKIIFITGITYNLSLLFFFKYTNFFISIVNSFSTNNFDFLDIILPLAISFFTFQQIAYLYDCYKGLVKDIDIWRYALFVSFFPQLICGPIVHYKEIVPQFDKRDFLNNSDENIAHGIILFTIGLFKKVVIADNLAIHADKIYSVSTQTLVSTFDAWYGTLAFTFQIYFDFSGYTDMALGLALFFGIKLPQNFNSPYKATNIYDLWQRWHISLTRFMRTHVFYPLSRNSIYRISVNQALFITIVLGGLWHGANWTFIIWGAMHGVLLLVNHYWRKLNLHFNIINFNSKQGIIFAIFLTFSLGMFSRVAFRAEDIHSMWGLYQSMLGYNLGMIANVIEYNVLDFALLIFVVYLVWFCPNSNEIIKMYANQISNIQRTKKGFDKVYKNQSVIAVTLATISIFTILSMNEAVEFIYFKF